MREQFNECASMVWVKRADAQQRQANEGLCGTNQSRIRERAHMYAFLTRTLLAIGVSPSTCVFVIGHLKLPIVGCITAAPSFTVSRTLRLPEIGHTYNGHALL